MSDPYNFFYKNTAALNVLAGSIENAKEIYAAAEGYVLVGVLSKNYPTAGEAAEAMKAYGLTINDAVSIGLGAGDNRQAAVVAEIVRSYPGSHVNQVFPAVGATRANLGVKDSWINSLVSPSGRVGYVNISTGPISSGAQAQAVVPVQAAIALVRDMGGNALKYYPMQGLELEAEYRAVAKACGEEGFALEPTGGIDLDNFGPILEIALQAGVPRVIPHVYSSIIDAKTGNTKVQDVKVLLGMMKSLVDQYV
ncbi:2-dehydro-3-deoxy-phosphogluconate aldolase [Paenibacillus donghaensis]|uniref:2-dehydro-3-deoxyphosphooctonate aldolase n=1 Tax=Paenibacillus donghaensis TaxID=414771 RepID=A0A2Z2KDW1_9BACL|nr:KDGP aldolase family protein [Paenibacillus donghaensis]ASA24204.1 2-dehydro-3-deoxyphosphooctonate aldolase [Paenibacillus donghaensis]